MNDFEKFNAYVEKIEYREIKDSGHIGTGIAVQVFAKEGTFADFIEWLAGETWKKNYASETFKSECGRAMRSKKGNPHFTFYAVTSRTLEVYPKQGMVEIKEWRIHYICQHGLDMFPYDVRAELMSPFPVKELGFLYLRKGRGSQIPEPIMVTSVDINRGFMQGQEENEKYDDDFGVFIYRRKLSKK